MGKLEGETSILSPDGKAQFDHLLSVVYQGASWQWGDRLPL